MHKAARLTQYPAPCDLMHDTANRELSVSAVMLMLMLEIHSVSQPYNK